MDKLKGEADGGVVMLSSGDNYLAGPEFNASLQLPEDAPLYDAVAISSIGYDALAIGNHEFDFGPDNLARFIIDVEGTVPFLSANLDFSGEPGLQALADASRIASRFIVETRGEKIGIVGATTPQLPFISSPRNVKVDADVAAIVQKEVNALLDEGIDKIIFISHLQSITEDSSLAAELSGIDIMIAGGGDELLANDDDLLIPGDEANISGVYPKLVKNADDEEIPVVTTSGAYKYVGRLSVAFDDNGNLLSIADDSGPVRVAGGANADAVEADSTLQADVVESIQASLAALASNVIGTSEVVLDGRRSSVRTRPTNLGQLAAESILWQAEQLADAFGVPSPHVAMQNGGGIRNDSEIEPGDMTELLTFDILPFANFVAVVPDIPAAQFKEIMENAVSQVEFVGGRFAQIAGFTYESDLNGVAQVLDANGNVTTPGSRIVSITLADGTAIVTNGAVVQNAPAITVATIDFLAGGGDQYPFRGADFTSLGVTYQQALASFIVDELEGVVSADRYPVIDASAVPLSKSLAGVDAESALPSEFALSQNYPNPFNPGTTIRYALPKAEHVKLVVFDILGREVAKLVDAARPVGYHTIEFKASSLPTGIYIYRITAGSYTQTHKMLLAK